MGKVCCVIGHRKILKSEAFLKRLKANIEELITAKDVDVFLFGSKSEFIRECYNVVSELKNRYPHIKRVYVRAEFPVIDKKYEEYLGERYEESFFPQEILNSGKAVYVERNCRMIELSEICLFYYDREYRLQGRKSGMKIAFEYAQKKKKNIINVFENKVEI